MERRVCNYMKIIEFNSHYTEKLINLILSIQVGEFAIKITRTEQPDLEIIPEFYQTNKGNYWIAVQSDSVIGSLGLVDIGNNQVALRKMFVHKDFRGKDYKIAQQLLDIALAWCKEKSINDIYLGTTTSYLAAHRFYAKNNFVQINKSALPLSFPLVLVDNMFYHHIITK